LVKFTLRTKVGETQKRAHVCHWEQKRALFRILDKSERMFVIENKSGRNSKPKFSRL